MTDAFTKFAAGSYGSMTKEEIAKDMDARYETGRAYPETRLWVDFHHKELERVMAHQIALHAKDKDILELGCGGGGVAAHNIRDARSIVATDLSEASLQIGRDFFKDRPELTFRRMDAEATGLRSKSIDIVIAKEVIEHLHNPERCLSEVKRVLRPGGFFTLSSPNRDSLHLRLNRKLGRPDFMCAGDHIKEFTWIEMMAMLANAGFLVIESQGVTLMPYHSVDGVFPPEVEMLEAVDEEFLGWMRTLGRRAGPEFAFGYIILAAKPMD